MNSDTESAVYAFIARPSGAQEACMRQILRGVPLFVLPAVLTISVAGCVDITAGDARFIDTVEKALRRIGGARARGQHVRR